MHAVVSIDVGALNEYERRAKAVVELFLRIGFPVRVVQGLAVATTDAFIHLINSEREPIDLQRNELWLPIRSTEFFEERVIDGRKCWLASNDVIGGTADLLDFKHERKLSTNVDRFGRISTDSHGDAYDSTVPYLDNNARELAAQIERRLRQVIPRRRAWGEASFVVAITHDVDGPIYFQFFSFFRSLMYWLSGKDRSEKISFEHGLAGLLSKSSDPYWNFAEWLRFARDLDYRPTFFIYPGPTGRISRHSKDPHYDVRSRKFDYLCHPAVRDTWELGLHKSINSFCSADMEREKTLLEERFHKPVKQVRAHYWAFDWMNTQEYWASVADTGFRTELSLTPMRIGYRNGTG